MLPRAFFKPGTGLILWCLIHYAFEASAAEEGARPYRFGAPAPGNFRTAIVQPRLQAMGAPVLNTIAPESTNLLPAIAGAERRGAFDQMLQSHELNVFSTRSRPLGLKDAQTASGAVDLDSIKVRISRTKVLIRAQFSFN
jgi:hypothetical protein